MTTRNWQQLQGQAAAGSQAVPASDYEVEIAKAKFKVASTGSPMWNVQFKVLAGPHANAIIWNNFVMKEDNGNALAIFFRHMAILGLDSEFFALGPSDDQVAQALIGKRAAITVSVREHPKGSGQMTNDVDGMRPSQFGVNEPVRTLGGPGIPGVPAAVPNGVPAAAPVAQPQVPVQPVQQPVAQPQVAPQAPAAAPVPQAAPAAPQPAPAVPEQQAVAPQSAEPIAPPAQPAPEQQAPTSPSPAVPPGAPPVPGPGGPPF